MQESSNQQILSKGTQMNPPVPIIVKKFIISEWNVELIQQDSLLCIKCHSLKHAYMLKKQITEVPQQLLGFCDNLLELAEFLETSGSLSILNQSLIVSCQVGKLKKEISLELKQEELALELRVSDLQELLKLQKQRVEKAQETIKNLSREMKKEVENLQKKLEKEKNLRIAAQLFKANYVQCGKFRCFNLIPLDKQCLVHRGKAVCNESCMW